MLRQAAVLVLLTSAVAIADPAAPITVPMPPHTASAQTATVLFFNRCQGGCTIHGGAESAVSHSSRLADECIGSDCTVTEFEHGDQVWNEVMACLREVYSPYNVMVTDVQPAPGVAYNENIIAGSNHEITTRPAGGIAPVSVDCSPYSDAISYTFANDYPPNPYTLCYVAAQETGHAYGMGDHSWSFISDGRSACSDPMSYRVDCLSQGERFFRNEAATCGDFSQATCSCGGMNSHLKLISALGKGNSTIPAPAITVTTPAPDSMVGANTQVIATASSKRGVSIVEMKINGYKWGEKRGVAFGQTNQPEAAYGIAIPAEVPDSILDIVMTAKDDIGTETSAATLTVTKGAPCADASTCAAGQKCEAGRCFWDPPTGEIGVECTYNQFCLSGMCLGPSGTDEMRCTQNCIPNVEDSCPVGYECLASGGANGACWPESAGSGCCSTGRDAAAQSALLAIGLLFLMRRRKRC